MGYRRGNLVFSYNKPKDAACNISLWLHCVSIGSLPVVGDYDSTVWRDAMRTDAVSYGWTDGWVDGWWRG